MRALWGSVFLSEASSRPAHAVAAAAAELSELTEGHFEIVDMTDWNLGEGRRVVGVRSDICSPQESGHMRLAMVAVGSVRHMTLCAFLHSVHHQTEKHDCDTA